MATISGLRGASAAPRRPDTGLLVSGDALVLDAVTRQFGALKAIDSVSLSVAAGERRAVLGANGAGKTTLFNAITGDFPPTAGRVTFFGEDITDLPPYERIRRGLRRTYQSSLLLRELTVRDNLFIAARGVRSGRFSFIRTRSSKSSVTRREACCGPGRMKLKRPLRTPRAAMNRLSRTVNSRSSSDDW